MQWVDYEYGVFVLHWMTTVGGSEDVIPTLALITTMACPAT
jgi:hypothetical protein